MSTPHACAATHLLLLNTYYLHYLLLTLHYLLLTLLTTCTTYYLHYLLLTLLTTYYLTLTTYQMRVQLRTSLEAAEAFATSTLMFN